ncbi:NAD(P)/FAD-dependent oxidoreductase [Adhaeribacter sp. BT258]|uniref:NAD(P)/FAD-dependent oxidoreductase n=1 Tax=Adhaeribacter terrigena TaxID=2793070 RepID=A0ABS1C5H4_9BACT|nr:NAD(P)/FAD-dependent oxidoreductase [Adhaeribacter terrigena]MBK0404638.1 NAD(P)/FAD-dependent oxidoreductase [Adhaeribacter terrigena]
MKETLLYDVIITGGSYAGLAAAMSLGRALRRVLVIDSGQPCNRFTPHSHNFLTQDGKVPAEIAALAREQVANYKTVEFHAGLAVSGTKNATGFEVKTQTGETFNARKLIFATGLKDLLPEIDGFAECWGKSVIHCPYCHGYEVRNEKTAMLANGDQAMHYAQLLRNWTKELTLLTNGKADLTEEQKAKLKRNQIELIETEILNLEQTDGQIQRVVFKDHSRLPVKALYHRPEFEQHCKIPQQLGCELTEAGFLKIDPMQRTTVPGVYACGDNATMRAVAMAVGTGMATGAMVNNDLCTEEFN